MRILKIRILIMMPKTKVSLSWSNSPSEEWGRSKEVRRYPQQISYWSRRSGTFYG
jgi:hypothetical protein